MLASYTFTPKLERDLSKNKFKTPLIQRGKNNNKKNEKI